MSNLQKLIWVVLMASLAAILYLAFQGYLAPGMLLDFANNLLC
jgi:hypothetical protein